MIDLSVRRPVAVAMGALAVALLGGAALLRIPVEPLPDVRLPRVTIRARWPGASPQSVEARVTARLEAAARRVRGAVGVRSESKAGEAEVVVQFDRRAPMELAALELSERLGALQSRLPPRVLPIVEPHVPRQLEALEGPLVEYALAGTGDPEDLRRIAERWLRPALAGVEGVAEVRLQEGMPRQIRIEMDPVRAAALGLGPARVAEAIRRAEALGPVGTRVRRGSPRAGTVVAGFDSPADLGDLVLETRGGTRVRLRDVARISDARLEPTRRLRIDGRPATVASIVARPGTNALRVAEALRRRASLLEHRLPPRVRLILLRDRSEALHPILDDLRGRAVVSTIAVGLVLLLAFRSVRASALLLSAVGLSLLLTVFFLYVTRQSLNVLTMAGLVMGLGLVVDNAIIVFESVLRRRERGDSAADAAERGARGVALPVLAGTLTTVIALAPVVYLRDELRVYYLPFSYALGLALIASVIVALTCVPAAATRTFRHPTASAGRARLRRRRLYRRLLVGALRRPWLPIGLAVLAVTVSLRFFGDLVRDSEWGRWGERTRVDVFVQGAGGADLESVDAIARRLESELVGRSDVARVVTRVQSNLAHLRVTFPDSLEESWIPAAIQDRLVTRSRQVGGASVRVYGLGPSFDRRPAGSAREHIRILGYDDARTRAVAEELGRKLRRFPRVHDVDVNASDETWGSNRTQEFVLDVDRGRVAAHGATAREILDPVATSMRAGLGGARLRLRDDEVAVSVRMAGYAQEDARALGNLLVPTRSGPVRLGAVAALHERRGPERLVREDQRYRRTITYAFRGPPALAARVRDAVVASTALPPGHSLETSSSWHHAAADEERQLAGVLLLAVFLVYALTAALFESLRDPFVVLLTLPPALAGALLVFAVTGESFTRSAHVGLVLTTGLAVNNAILLIHHIQRLRAVEGLKLAAAVARGTLQRARPILLTTTTTLVGAAPIVLATARDADLWAGLGRAVVGGLVASALCTLTVTPALYLLLARRGRDCRSSHL